jgi:plastocyanin
MALRSLRPVAAVSLLVLAAACGGGSKEAAPVAPPADAKRVDESKTGTLTGRVVLDGPAPANAPIRMASDPFCLRAHPDGASLDRYVVDNGGLANVFVYVKDGLGNYYFDIPKDAVKLDQQGCRYVPHVFGVRAGQPIEIRTSDDTMHNVHAMPEKNQEFNFGQQLAGATRTKTFTAPEIMIPFKCDVHAWMNAYAGVLTHPYFAVTHAGGTFELKNLPAGTYTVEAWHEKLGTQTHSVTLGEKESKDLTFTFKAAGAAAD